MVGRADERRTIADALSAARSGVGNLLLVGGPAGIGKSALADAACSDASGIGLDVVRSYAVDDPGAPPLWPWTRLLLDWPVPVRLPGTEPGEPDAAARFRLGRAVVELLSARAQDAGMLVVLEDLHWADRGSLLLLQQVVHELPTMRICVLATYRDTAAGGFSMPIPELVRGPDAHVISLRGLDTDEVAAMLPTLSGRPGPSQAAALRRRTGGNPLLIRLMAESAGSGDLADLDLQERPQVRRLVLGRLAGLPSEVRTLLDAAAVIGERIPVAALTRMTARSPEEVTAALAAAAGAGVLSQGAGGIAFEHALVRDAVYAEIGANRRDDLHRAAAEALAADGQPPSVVAAHWHRVGGTPAAARCAQWAARASERAHESLAFEDAARFAQLAVDRTRSARLDPAALARALLRAAVELVLVNRFEDAVAACVEAADIAEGIPDIDLLTRAGLVVRGVGNPGLVAAVASICRRALGRLDADDHAARARLNAQISVGITETEGGPGGAALAARALAEADMSGDQTAIVEALAARHLAITVPSTVLERLELGRRAVALGVASDQPIVALWGHLWRCGAALQLGNMAEVDREVGEVDRVARERGSVLARWHHHRLCALRSLQAGDFRAARASDRAALELGQRVEDISLIGMSFAFRNYLGVLRGSASELPPGWEDLLARAPRMPLVQLCLPIQHALAGDLDLARAEFEEYRDLPRTYPVGVRWVATLLHVGITAVLVDDAEVAGATYEAMLGLVGYYSSDGSGAIISHGANARFVADLALTARRPHDALPLYRDSVGMNARIGARPFTALSRSGWARALVALGEDRDPVTGDAATDLCTTAAAEFERLDMPGPLAAARDLLLAMPAQRSRSGLTAREDEVAELVAQALSNREIAQRLFLSERTVETHVRSILAKLHFSSRTEIATWRVGGRSR